MNFAAEAVVGSEIRKWLGEGKGWMFWSDWRSEETVEGMREVGLEVVVQEMGEDLIDNVKFLWILARESGL